MVEAPQKSVGPGFEPVRWSFSCRHSSEQGFQNHYRARRYCIDMFNSTPVSLPSTYGHSRKCATCYSVECSSGCVAEVVELV